MYRYRIALLLSFAYFTCVVASQEYTDDFENTERLAHPKKITIVAGRIKLHDIETPNIDLMANEIITCNAMLIHRLARIQAARTGIALYNSVVLTELRVWTPAIVLSNCNIARLNIKKPSKGSPHSATTVCLLSGSSVREIAHENGHLLKLIDDGTCMTPYDHDLLAFQSKNQTPLLTQ